MKRIVCAPLILILTLAGSASGQEPVSKRGTTAAPFLEFAVGSRAVGMGKAFTAIANDATAMYWNVAGLEQLPSNEVSFSYMNWIADMDFIYAGLVIKAGSAGTFGLSVTSLSTPEMLVRTVDQPEGLGWRFDAADMAFGLSYAKHLTDRFTFGGSFKYIQRRIWHMEATAIAADFGILYSLPWQGMKIGMSITNFGSKLQMQGVDAVVPTDIDPTMAGNNGTVLAQLRTKEWALPLTFRFGLGYEAISSPDHKVTVATDYLHPNNNEESANVGMEYEFRETLSLRAGYQSLFMQDSEEGLTIGVGLKQSGISFDYAYSALVHLGTVHQFSVRIVF
jgi:long-subunit fatty acid transport protein